MAPPRRRINATYLVVLLVVLVAAFFIVMNPVGAPTSAPPPPLSGEPLPATQSATKTPTPSTTTTTQETPSPSSTRKPTTLAPTATKTATCRVGTPSRLVIPALDVDAWFEKIGLDYSLPPDANGRYPLGNPKDRTKAGWYSAGPKPGAGRGTVLTNGHTYRNNSAIFKEDFATRIATGQLIHVVQDNKSICSYVVGRVWREVDSVRDYPKIIASENLYDFGGPERLFLATCGGDWNAAAQDYENISILIATPVNR